MTSARKYIPAIFALTIVALTAVIARAQHFLPSELTFPPVVGDVAEEEEIDVGIQVNTGTDRKADADSADADDSPTEPGTLDFSVNHTLFDRSYTGINNFVYYADFGSVYLEQSVWYELRRDRLQNTRHYLNAAGALKFPLEDRSWITPGFDWTPVAQYSSDRGGRNSLATIDIGPTADFNVAGVPFNARAGISGRRVDSLAGAFFQVGEYRSSVGAYGAFSLGSWEEPLPFAPIYFLADGIGRQIEQSSMTSLTSSAIGALQFGEKDSIFIYGSVSLFNGREGYLESSADSRVSQFVETPWRVERSATSTIGYKGARKSIIYPTAYYSVSENVLEFSNDDRRRDEKTIRQILSGGLSTDSTAGLYYGGSLTFEWRDHDKLFGKEMARTATPSNIDSLNVNLWDYSSFDPRTAHRLILNLPRSTRLKYDFGANRFLTEYPNYYVNGRDTVTNNDDSDRRTIQHRLALEYRNDSTFRAELFGELVEYDLVFLKQAKSSSNRTDNTQRAGLIMEWAPASELLITEAVTAEAKRGEFHFPAFHQSALQRPRYSRAVSSSFSVIWQTTPLVGLSGDWDIKISDYGFWYGREYMEEVLETDPNARVDYYAVTSKSVYYTIDAALRLSPRDLLIKAGGAITVARDRNYESGNYILTNENGFSVKPYLYATWGWGGKIDMAAHLSRTFVPGNKAMGFWDFRLQAEGGF